jgi:uncharacterized protein YigA (DUF484 family)
MSNQKSGITDQDTEKLVASGLADGDEQTVADYLRRHPNFFEDKPSLLADLRIPHSTGSAVSLVERQVTVLRNKNAGLQEQLNGLIHIARENDRLNTLLHQLTLQLMGSNRLAELLDLISEGLRRDFSADVLALRLLKPPRDESCLEREEFVADVDGFCGPFQRLLSAGKPYCGRLKTEQLQALFLSQADSVASSALLPLGSRGEWGLLAIGSFDRNRFHPGADTAFLGRMAEVVSAALGQHLQLSSPDNW